jgi:hypothetical protein
MIYWILYGILVTTKGHTNNITLPLPVLFNNELKCLKIKELNEKDLINKFDKIELVCTKVELVK